MACYATLDTEAIGSCRLPAACCGVVGFKGTYGLISNEGVLDGEPVDEMILWLAHAAITTRCVRDTALALDALAERNEHTKGVDYFGGLAKTRKLRIGVANNFNADHEVSAAVAKAAETIHGLGHPVAGVAVPFADLRKGIGNIEADRQAIAGIAFKDCDVLALPTTATTVPHVTDAGGNPQALSPENTAFANYYGLPAISVPCGLDSNGLPIGLQAVARPWDEEAALLLASQYQAAADKSPRRR